MKRWLRRCVVGLNGLGLGLLLRRLGLARGGAVVMTHCVGHVPATAYLPADMKTSTEKVEQLLRALARRGIRVVPVRELVAALDRGEDARDLVAFTMDDGYRDNLTQALPLLRRHGASGTVFVETHAVGARVVSWMHRYFYVVHLRGEEYFAREYAARTAEPEIRARIEAAARGPSALGARYDLKRVLKYDADLADRDRVSREILASIGARDEDLVDAFLTWPEVEELAAAGIEIGPHTVHHEILARLDPVGMRREIEQSTRSVREHVRAPVETFAYPFGRPWDYSADCFPVLRELGFRSACAAIDGTNDPATDRMQLRRFPLNDAIPLGDLLAEIDGSLPLARRLLRIQL